LPETVRDLARLHLEQIAQLGAHVAALDKRMRAEAARSSPATPSL
jgi:transposase